MVCFALEQELEKFIYQPVPQEARNSMGKLRKRHLERWNTRFEARSRDSGAEVCGIGEAGVKMRNGLLEPRTNFRSESYAGGLKAQKLPRGATNDGWVWGARNRESVQFRCQCRISPAAKDCADDEARHNRESKIQLHHVLQ